MRDFKPVEPIDPPNRLSVTFLKLADHCMRAGYLALAHKGAASHRMLGGSAFHTGAERLMLDLIESGEQSVYAPQTIVVGESLALEEEKDAKLGLSQTTAAIVDEILEEDLEHAPPAHEADAVRQMLYHLAIGNDVNPQSVVGVEQPFVLELDAGWQLVGKVDLAYLLEPGFAAVDDFKTGYGIPGEGDFLGSTTGFQLRTYAVLLAFGRPATFVNADGQPIGPGDDREDGRYVATGPRMQGLQRVRARAVYPRYLTGEDGDPDRRLRCRVLRQPDGREWLSRQMLHEHRLDLERRARAVSAAFSSWDWPAVPGDHCSECPAQALCPIPKELRNYAGSMNHPEEAGEALDWADRTSANVRAVRAEARRFIEHNGPAPAPVGMEYALEVKATRALRKRGGRSDLDGLLAAATAAAEFGEAFDPAEFVREGQKTELVKRPVESSSESEAA